MVYPPATLLRAFYGTDEGRAQFQPELIRRGEYSDHASAAELEAYVRATLSERERGIILGIASTFAGLAISLALALFLH